LLGDIKTVQSASNEGEFDIIKQLLSGDFKALDEESG